MNRPAGCTDPSSSSHSLTLRTNTQLFRQLQRRGSFFYRRHAWQMGERQLSYTSSVVSMWLDQQERPGTRTTSEQKRFWFVCAVLKLNL